MSTLKTTNLQHASAASPSIVLASDGSATAQLSSINDGPLAGTRNRIINGDMRIDQRNAGAAVTVTTDGFGGRQFPVDRFPVQKASSCVLSAVQSSDTPASEGFTNSLKVEVATADASIGATDNAFIGCRIEGYNVADFGFGGSTTNSVTLSFWVRSSVTGTYCVGFGNYADNRTRPVEYSITSANTWERKSITITTDTTGAWNKDASGGLNINWTLAAGTNFQGTNNAWQGGIYLATSNQTQLVSTLNATFYLTGVQLEAGSVATPFERRSYGQELALCQRYYEEQRVFSSYGSGTFMSVCANYKITKRAVPTIVVIDAAGNVDRVSAIPVSGGSLVDNITQANSSTTTDYFRSTISGASGTYGGSTFTVKASAEL